MIGQTYAKLLADHPWLELSEEVSSRKGEFERLKACEVVFSALPGAEAISLEPELAKAGVIVISNASAHRSEPDVPLIIPEINSPHLALVEKQRKNRNWRGAILAKPNCTLQTFLLPLAPLHNLCTLESISVTTLQAVSGAGQNALRADANVIPFIAGEEEKLASESQKILEAPGLLVGSQCNRVPVLEGHLCSLNVSFKKRIERDEILAAWDQKNTLDLPSAPAQAVYYHLSEDRPQPLLDCHREGGMAITVGRLRPSPFFDWSFVALSHNLLRGGAGGGILLAELLKQEGYIG